MKDLYVAFNSNWKDKALTKNDGKLYFNWLDKLGIDYGDNTKKLPVLGSLDHGKTYKKVNLAYNWRNVTVDLDGVFMMLAEEGFSMTPHLLNTEGKYQSNSQDGYRTSNTFAKTNVALVDIDNGLSINDVESDNFYKDYCSGYYTTKKHTEQANRFRMIFVLDRVINKNLEMRALLTALIKMFGGDEACKDPARLFYGYKGGVCDKRQNKIIPNDVIDMLIELGTVKQHIKLVDTNIEYSPPSDEERQYVIEELRNTFIGNQSEWLRVAIGLYNGGYTLQQFTYASIGGMMNSKTERDCAALWNDASKYNNVTMGTVWHIIGGYNKFNSNKIDKEIALKKLKIKKLKQRLGK